MNTVQASDVGTLLANVHFDTLLTNVGVAIAKAQAAMDDESIRILGEMCEKEVSLPALQISKGKLSDHPITTTMIGAGFQPTFYQFAETIIEIKMTINLTTESTEEKTVSGEEKKEETTSIEKRTSYRYRIFGRRNTTTSKTRTVVTTTPIDATYTNKYTFNQEGSSLLRTRLVPVPPNTIIQRQLEMRAQAMQLEYDLQLKEYELYLEMLRESREKKAEETLKNTEKEIETELEKEGESAS